MATLNLDDWVVIFRARIANGEASEDDRFIVSADDFDTVAWTGPDGVVNEAPGRVECYEITPIVLGRL